MIRCSRCLGDACCFAQLPNDLETLCVGCLASEVRGLRAILDAGAAEAVATRVVEKLAARLAR